MSLSQVEQYVQNDEEMRLFQQEKLILEFTESICEIMEKNNISRTELASKLGTSNAHITHILNGTRNMTLRTASDLAWALGKTYHIEAMPLTIHTQPAQKMVHYHEEGKFPKSHRVDQIEQWKNSFLKVTPQVEGEPVISLSAAG